MPVTDPAGPRFPTYADLRSREGFPPGSSWGVFGDDAENGTLNFLTPERVRAAAGCVRRGAVFNLDYPLDAFPGPVRFRPNPEHHVYYVDARSPLPHGRTDEPTAILDDYVDSFAPQGSSHVDGLRHAIHPVHGLYGGISAERILGGEPALGIDRWAERGIAGRGVLVDVAGYREAQGRPLDHLASEVYGIDLVEEILAAQGTEVRRGDMVVLRTDYPRHVWEHADDDAAAFRSAGLAKTYDVVSWLWDNQVALLACDNIAIEPVGTLAFSEPSEFGEGREGMLHSQLIPLLGLVLGELWKLDDLAADCAADGVYEFLLVVKPLNLPGGCGSPANATAIK